MHQKFEILPLPSFQKGHKMFPLITVKGNILMLIRIEIKHYKILDGEETWGTLELGLVSKKKV